MEKAIGLAKFMDLDDGVVVLAQKLLNCSFSRFEFNAWNDDDDLNVFFVFLGFIESNFFVSCITLNWA